MVQNVNQRKKKNLRIVSLSYTLLELKLMKMVLKKLVCMMLLISVILLKKKYMTIIRKKLIPVISFLMTINLLPSVCHLLQKISKNHILVVSLSLQMYLNLLKNKLKKMKELILLQNCLDIISLQQITICGLLQFYHVMHVRI